ncbi:MAG: UDP-N-acetylglucosamine--dolichyl-phosphate N-acetylglucosaminephosphotransferase [archaeon]
MLSIGILAFVGSAAVGYFTLPFLIRRMVLRNLVGPDMNKLNKPMVAELGGIGVLFGFIFGIMAALGADSFFGGFGGNAINLTALLAAFSTVLIIGLVGIFDDIIGWKNGIRKWQHALFPVFAALPLMVLPQSISVTALTIPFFGPVSFGILYSFLVVPVAITGASNAVNMLGGLNGLEAGMGALISFTLLLIMFFLPAEHAGRMEVIILMAAMLGVLIVFLKFNWFPAKIFGGDSLTLMIGASIAAASIIGNVEKIGLILFSVYFVELAVKAKHRFQSECFGVPQRDGTLAADPRGGSITQWVMKMGNLTEPEVVWRILGIQALICAFVFFLFWFKLFKFVGG